MAECPKCHEHLRLSDWRQTCPHCGANIVLYDLQERLMSEADKAEVQYYHFQKKVDRVKTSFVGSKLAIVRIFTSLLPLGAIFLPLIKAVFREPFEPFEGNINALKIYGNIDKISTSVFSELLASPDTRAACRLLIGSAVLFLLSFLIMAAHFICLTLACSPKGKPRSYILDIAFILCSVGCALTAAIIPENPVVSVSLGAGAYCYIALAVLNFVADVLVFRQNIPVHHAQCYVGGIPIEEYFKMVEDGVPQAELRAEMYRRLTAIQMKKDAELRAKQEKQEKEEAAINA